MGSRKKSKINHVPTADESAASSKASLPLPDQPEDPPRAVDTPDQSTSLKDTPTPTGAAQIGQVNNRKSWYGSWTQKSPAVSLVETENVTAERGPSAIDEPETKAQTEFPDNNNSPARYLSDGARRSFRGTPLETSTTKLTITSTNGNTDEVLQSKEPPQDRIEPATEPPLPPDPPKLDESSDAAAAPNSQAAQQPPSSWFGWWSRPDGYIEKPSRESTVVEEAQKTPLPGVSPVEEVQNPISVPVKDVEPMLAAADASRVESDKPLEPADGPQSRSWFWRWSRAQNARSDETTKAEDKALESGTADAISESKPASTPLAIPTRLVEESETKPASIKDDKPGSGASTPRLSLQRKKSSGWAFWSKEPPSPSPSADGPVHKLVGELAVSDTPSQSNPEAAQFNEQEQARKVDTPQTNSGRGTRSAKDEKVQSKPATKVDANTSLSQPLKSAEPPLTPTKLPSKQVAKEPPRPNLLLPEFRSTYSLANESSFWKQIRGYFFVGENEPTRLRIQTSPPRVKKAISIGVHGFFPSPIVQKVLGAPTGTSIKFANAGAAAIKQWTEERGYDCEIEKVALEGEGFISDRVDTLWKLLLNWVDHIQQADFILVGCHSQGVPVAIMLVAKLIESGCVNSARIGVCAMAGVNLGPFMDFKTRFFGGTTLELFDFSNPSSKVSQMYQTALGTVLRHGVRVAYVGSIDDQLVSMESSTFSNITHPYLYRAVFVDGRIHSADFITHLVGFALKLRNLGLPDHGLIRELSPALAGSIYSGEGHSRLYDDPAVYNLAVSHALETTSLGKEVPLVVKEYEGPPGYKEGNPYFLPWAMRGVLEEEKVRKELADECQQLLALFDQWRPSSRGLKDVKFRLEALKSRL